MIYVHKDSNSQLESTSFFIFTKIDHTFELWWTKPITPSFLVVK